MFNPTWFYAGAVYAAAVALARRGGCDIPKRVAVFFYSLVFIFMYLPLTQEYVNIPVGVLKTLPPFSEAADTRVGDRAADAALQIVPWAHQVRESWKSLSPPLWSGLSAAGYPLLANPESAALSPLRLVALPLSLGHAMTFEAAMKILIALTLAYLWCRRRGYSDVASAIGAVAFGFSTALLEWLHFSLATTACLVPAVFYLIDLLGERVTFARFVAAAVAGAAMLFGGHPKAALLTLALAALYALWMVGVERIARPALLLVLAGAAAVAVMLAAPLVVPMIEALPHSIRFDPGAATAEVPFAARGAFAATFAGWFGVAAWLALVIHVVATRAWRSREMFFVVATALGVASSRADESGAVMILVALLFAVQSAAAVDLMSRDRRALLAGIAGASALLLFLGGTSTLATASSAVLAFAALASMLNGHHFALLALLVAVIAELSHAGRERHPPVSNDWMYPDAPLLRALEDLQSRTPSNEPFRISGEGTALLPNLSAMYGHEDARAADRMANSRYVALLPAGSDRYFAPRAGSAKRLIDFMNVRFVVAAPGATPPPTYGIAYVGADGRIFENPAVLPRFFPVRNVILEFRDDVFARRLEDLEDWAQTALIDRLEVESPRMREDLLKPRPGDAPLASARIVEASPTAYRLVVDAPRYTLVVSSIPLWPGWKVSRKGASTAPMRVNGAFLGFAVPPGKSDVRVAYEPWSFRAGAIVSLVAVLALAGYGVFRSRARHRSSPLSPPRRGEG